MTEFPRCRWCRRPLPAREGRGRRRQFCSPRCRQSQWVSRQGALELGPDERVVLTSQLDELHDDLYILSCAVDDAERDLAADDASPTELRHIIAWLLEAARPLRTRQLVIAPRSERASSQH